VAMPGKVEWSGRSFSVIETPPEVISSASFGELETAARRFFKRVGFGELEEIGAPLLQVVFSRIDRGDYCRGRSAQDRVGLHRSVGLQPALKSGPQEAPGRARAHPPSQGIQAAHPQ
jgi:hypothetical protein